MKLYRIKINGAGNGYVKGVLFSIEEGFQVIATNIQEEAGWYEEDKAKIYCEELNKQSIDVKFKLEEVENNEKNKKKEDIKICMNCGHCIYIGEGDYMCDANSEPVLVMEEHCPNDNYWYCAGTEWEAE